jgi:hypothetical protein
MSGDWDRGGSEGSGVRRGIFFVLNAARLLVIVAVFVLPLILLFLIGCALELPILFVLNYCLPHEQKERFNVWNSRWSRRVFEYMRDWGEWVVGWGRAPLEWLLPEEAEDSEDGRD